MFKIKLIEYDGEQHFKPINWFGGKKAYELQKIKDNIKTEYCFNNNIHLLRFNFNDRFDIIRNDIGELIKNKN